MFKHIILFSCAICSVLHTSTASIVPFIKPCKANDNDCLLAANMQIAIPYLADGIAELGIPPAEPMFFENITMDQGYVSFQLPELKVLGAKKCRLIDFKQSPSTSTIKITLDCPLIGTGTYKFSGKICIFNIDKAGDFKIETDSMKTTITIKTEEISGHDGRKYWKLLNYNYSYEPLQALQTELTGLFAGDVAKATPFLSVIDKEWGTDVVKVGQPIADEIVKYFFNVLRTFFLSVPIDQIAYV